MSSLSGQSIQSTYQGLLKLSNSTTGITSTYQAIEDGLGNITNSKISTNGIISPNIASQNNLKPDYGGLGFSTSSLLNVASTQNNTHYYSFYDVGLYSFSSITYSVNTATTTNDVVSLAFYTHQQLPIWGIAPGQLIMSGITLTTNSTGVKTTTLPSTLSFSGYGGGNFIAAFIYTNSGVTPTVTFTNVTTAINYFQPTFGYYLNNAGTALFIGSKWVNMGNISTVVITGTTFKNSYTISDLGYVSSRVGGIGFGLNTI